MSQAPTAEDERDALKHAWDWFALHAGQRMQAVSHFLVAFALVLAGYGVAYQSRNYVIAVGIAIAGILMSASFLLLESRTRELVQVAEPALASLQARLAIRSGTPDLEFVKAIDKPAQTFRKYAFVIRALMTSGILVMSLAASVAIIGGLQAPKSPDAPAPCPTSQCNDSHQQR